MQVVLTYLLAYIVIAIKIALIIWGVRSIVIIKRQQKELDEKINLIIDKIKERKE